MTAGAGKLGECIASALAESGADVVVNYRSSRERADLIVKSLVQRFGGRHLAIQADLALATEVKGMVGRIEAELGAVGVLVNNAGPFSKTPFLEMTESEWDDILASNLRAAYLCAAAVAPGMKRAGWGRIINLSAVSAYVRNRSIYGLAKSSLETFTEALAIELGPEVTVNAVAPGQIAESLEEMSGIDADWADSVLSRTPLDRLVTRSEVANLIALMCTPTFDMMTGEVIAMDGGLRLPRF